MRSVKHGGKKGLRYKFKLPAVKRQNKKQKKKGRKIGCKVIDKAWNTGLTTRQNLARIGLAYDPNEIIGMPEEKMEVDEMYLDHAKSLNSVKKQIVKSKGKLKKDNAVVKELEQIALVEASEVAQQKEHKKTKAKLLKSDMDFCEKMIAKYGEDYEAMSRDASNIWQNTPRQIERKLTIYKRSRK